MRLPLIVLIAFLLSSSLAAGLTLLSPDDGAGFLTVPGFNWSHTDPNASFELNISNSSTMDYVLLSSVQSETSYIPASLDVGTFYWRVAAITVTQVNISNSTVNETVVELSEIRSFIIEETNFTLELGPPTLFVNDTLLIFLRGPDSTAVHLQIFGPIATDTYSTSITGNETTLIYIPTDPGPYIVNATFTHGSRNETHQASFTAELENPPVPMQVSISASRTEPEIGQPVSFTAQVTDAPGDITYAWDVNDDGSIEGNTENFDYSFLSAGNYVISLTVNSGAETAKTEMSMTVVKPMLLLEVFTYDAGSALGGTELWIDSLRVKTNSAGKASMNLREGDYRLNLSRDGYEDQTYVLNLQTDMAVHYNLTVIEEKSDPPRVTLTNALSTVKGTSVEITYSVSDKDKIDECRLFYNLMEFSGWRTLPEQEDVTRDAEHSFTLSSLQHGRYRYRVRCTDDERERGFSTTAFLDVNDPSTAVVKSTSGGQVRDDLDTGLDQLVAEYDSLILKLGQLSGSRRSVADALELMTVLKNSKVQLKNQQKKLAFQSGLGLDVTNLDQIKSSALAQLDSMPSDIKDVAEHEFIGITNNDGVFNASAEYLLFHGIASTQSSLKKYAKKNQELQKGLDIYTRATVVEVRSLGGSAERYTLITREIKGTTDLTGTVLVDSIPKDVLASASSIIFLSPYSVIEDDPIIQFNVENSAILSYLVKRELTADEIERIRSVVLYRDLDLRTSRLTGFVAASVPESKTKLILSELALMILMGSMAAFVYGRYMRPEKPDAIKRKLVRLLSSTQTRLQAGDASAFRNYYEIIKLYMDAPEELKDTFAPFIEQMGHHLERRVAEAKIRESHEHLNTDDLHRAHVAHVEAHNIMNALPDHHREKLYAPLNTLGLAMDLKSRGRQ